MNQGLSAENDAAPSHQLESLITALLAGDQQRCERISASVLADHGPLELYQEFFRPALYRIGERWACNGISVSRERLATAIVERLMNDVYAEFVNVDPCGRLVLLATVEDELHQVGLKMVSDLFESHGWDSHRCPVGCPVDVVLDEVERRQPDVLGLSCSVRFHLDVLQRMLERINVRFPELPVLVGGQAMASGGLALIGEHPGTTLVADLKELQYWLVHRATGAKDPPR